MRTFTTQLAVVIAMAYSAVLLPKNQMTNNCAHHDEANASRMVVQGKHCSGSVGCSCSGFSPITNGKVWQQAYCKHCGHKKSSHR